MKAVFFVRHNNDFDSLAAVADAWVDAAPANEALIYVSSPALKWRDDFRTRMLRRKARVAFADLWQVAGWRENGFVERLWQSDEPDRRLRRRMLEMATEILAAPGFDRKLAAMLAGYGPDIVAFDWWNVPARRKPFDHFGYQAALRWVKEDGAALISLPHGMMLYEGKTAAFSWQTPYDLIFMENERRKQKYIAGGHPESQIAICGAPRYDPSWVERVVEELRGTAAKPRNDGDFVNIVFFDKRHAFYFDFTEHLDWLIHLANHPRVKLTVQPHPRGQKLKSLRPLVDHPDIRIDAESPASLLIDRSDIVSTLTSSVMVEAVLTGREILYPKFLSSVSTRFEEKGACIALDSAGETHGAIDRYLAGERVPRTNYDGFLKEVAFGGDGTNTRQRICKRMMELVCDRKGAGGAGEPVAGPGLAAK